MSIEYKLCTCLQKIWAHYVTHVLQCNLDTSYTGYVVLTCRPGGAESVHNLKFNVKGVIKRVMVIKASHLAK